MKRTVSLLIASIPVLLISAIPPEINAQAWITESGYVEFASEATMLSFKGTSNHLTGLIDLEKNLIDFYVDLNTLETGISRRDRDMRTQYLETDQYRYAEFTGSLRDGFNPNLEETQEVVATGQFTIHGVEREIEVSGTLTPLSSDSLRLEASWTVRLEDHNIDRPGVLFLELSEEQKVSISADLAPYVETEEN
ncbi:MAG: YceI family protein [Balneolaceae bacterium]